MTCQQSGLCLAPTADECSCRVAETHSAGASWDPSAHDESCCPPGGGLRIDRDRLAATLAGWIQPADVEDLMQEAFIRALTRPMELRGRRSTFAWLRRLLRNLAIDHIRHEDVERRARARLALHLRVQGLTSTALEDVHWDREIVALLEHLPPKYGEVVRRVDLEDASIEQVARELGLTEGNVRVRLHRGRAKLRERWVEQHPRGRAGLL